VSTVIDLFGDIANYIYVLIQQLQQGIGPQLPTF